MLRPSQWRVQSSHPADFIRERYADVFAWCLQITGDNVEEAEDLVQDAFLLFRHSTIPPDSMRNLRGYLYVVLRNLHRSRYERKRRHVPLPILDYDCAQLGLAVTDSSHMLMVAEQLRAICRFACERKETARNASVLLLRYFHGYYPTEIGAILVAARQSVHEHLRTIREETRAFLAGANKPFLIDASTSDSRPKSAEPASRYRVADAEQSSAKGLLDELRDYIFASCTAACPGDAALARWYRPDALTPVPTEVLAHIVSCRTCLSEVTRLLNLPPLDTRNPTDSTGKEPGPGPRIVSRSNTRPARPTRDARMQRLDRLAGEFFEHRPQVLCVAANGQPLALQPVSGHHTEITLKLQQSTGIDFIEVFSEQDVRLLMIPIPALPPDGSFEQSARTQLSEGRELKATFRYTSPWPSLHVSYTTDVPVEQGVPIGQAQPQQSLSARRPGSPGQGKQSWWPEWLFSWRPTLQWLGAVLALFAMFAYLFEQNQFNTAEARTLVAACSAWENSVREAGATVVRQRFQFREKTSPKREIVEVWRGSGRHGRLLRVVDDAGRVLRTSESLPVRSAAASPENLWQFDPSAETFASFTMPEESLKVHTRNAMRDVEASRITLTLDAGTRRPVAEVLRVEGREFEFVETAFDLVPVSGSPISASAPASPEPPRPIATVTPGLLARETLPSLPTPGELDLAELQARLALHQLGADLQEGVKFERRPDAIGIDLLVDNRERRDQIRRALADFPFVMPRFRVVEELTAAPPAMSMQTSAVPYPPTRYEPLMQAYLRERLASVAAANQVMVAAGRASDDLLHRAVALAQLSERYPADQIAKLQPEGRRELLKLVESHLERLAIERQNFNSVVIDLVKPVAVAVPDTPPVLPIRKKWTEAANELLRTAQVIQSISSGLFADTTRPPGGDVRDLASQVTVLGQRLRPLADEIRMRLLAEIEQ